MDLNNLEAIKNLDKSNVRDSVAGFVDQIKQTWKEIQKINPPHDYNDVKNILLAGMGGSIFGGKIIKSLYSDLLHIPFDVTSDYRIPAYVNRSTLVVAASYSGNTEETVTSLEKAHQKDAKIFGLTCRRDSNLANYCSLNKIPYLVLEPKFNPSGQPRTGSGYMILGAIGLLYKLGFIPLLQQQVEDAVSMLKKNLELFKIESKIAKNPAKKLALKYFNKNVILVGAEFLEGALYPLRNPLHETGKNFAAYFSIPNLNHHLLESLPNPPLNRESFIYVFLESDFYSDPIKRRMDLTEKVVAKNNLTVEKIKLNAKDQFGQVLEAMQLGGFAAFYLAILNGVNPATVPWVTYFQDTFRRSHS